jgi:hypothetical protein
MLDASAPYFVSNMLLTLSSKICFSIKIKKISRNLIRCPKKLTLKSISTTICLDSLHNAPSKYCFVCFYLDFKSPSPV